MKPRMSRACIAALLLCSCVPAFAQLTVRDDLERLVQVKQVAKRIVTLAPFLTEIVFAVGAGDRVVGVADLSTYPPEADKVTKIPTGAHFSLDRLAQVKPDLVIAWRDGIRRDDIERISGFGAVVFAASARSLEDVPRLMRTIAVLTGNDASAQIAAYERKLDALRRDNAGKPRVGAFLEIWNRPLTTISGNHFMNEALEICRADNVFKDMEGSAPQVTWEEVYERNPYTVIGAGSASNEEEFKSNWNVRQALSAVKADRLVYVDADSFMRPTPRTPDGIALLCAGLDKVRPAAPREAARSQQRPSQYGM